MSELAIKDFVKRMDLYIEKVVKAETPEQSREALIRTGVLEKDGKTLAKRHRMDLK